jgi:Transposase, Mutator family
VGHAGVALERVGPEQEDLRNDRSLAQSAIEGEHPYVYLDGIVLKRSWAGEVRNVSLLVAIGVNESGYREILGICEGAKEDKAGWSAFLKQRERRGVLSRDCLAKVRRTLVPQYLRSRALDQGCGRLRPCSRGSTQARTLRQRPRRLSE